MEDSGTKQASQMIYVHLVILWIFQINVNLLHKLLKFPVLVIAAATVLVLGLANATDAHHHPVDAVAPREKRDAVHPHQLAVYLVPNVVMCEFKQHKKIEFLQAFSLNSISIIYFSASTLLACLSNRAVHHRPMLGWTCLRKNATNGPFSYCRYLNVII